VLYHIKVLVSVVASSFVFFMAPAALLERPAPSKQLVPEDVDNVMRAVAEISRHRVCLLKCCEERF
jgi:hypothetical protein